MLKKALFFCAVAQWPEQALDRQLSNDNNSNPQNGAMLLRTFAAEIRPHFFSSPPRSLPRRPLQPLPCLGATLITLVPVLQACARCQ